MNETFPQTADASPREHALFAIARGRTALLAAVQGMLAGSAERPLGEGKWCVRQVVLHVMTWDRESLRCVETCLAGKTPAWMHNDPAEEDRLNAEMLIPVQATPWDEAMRMLHLTRLELLERIEAVPAEPAAPWDKEHAFGKLMRGIAWHDRHHADIIKRWRTEAGV